MIVDYGMSKEFGMVNTSLLGNRATDLTKNEAFLEEVKYLSKTIYNETLEFMKENHLLLEKIANALIERETLSEQELDEIIANHQAEALSLEK